MSLRLEKTFGISDFGRLGLFVDVYNLFNSAYISTVSSLSVWAQGDFHGYIEADGSFRESPRWQKVNSVNQPRVVKLGVRFTF
jgi:outer membrane receptor protein involved in Fe transport